MDGNAVSFSLPAAFKWGAAFVVADWVHVPGLMRALIICMLIDYGTGVVSAFVRKELSSWAGLRGLAKKVLILTVLLTAHILEKTSGIELNFEQIGALAYLVNEIVSIIENCAKAGIPIPSQLVEALLSFKRLKVTQATAEQLSQLSGDVKLDAVVTVKKIEVTPANQEPADSKP